VSTNPYITEKGARKGSHPKQKKKQKLFYMKGIFWNGNGFADPKKYKFLSDLTKEKKISWPYRKLVEPIFCNPL
jgi:hypothetical protein